MRSASTARALRAAAAGAVAVVGLGWGPAAASAAAADPAAPELAAPELAFGQTAPVDGIRPGSASGISFSVTNRGDGPATRVALFVTGTQGLSFAEKYSNCVYEEVPAQDEGAAQVTAVCDIEQTLEPGVVYVPEKPVGVTVLDRALYEHLSFDIQADVPTFPEGTQHGGGAGPVLRLVARQPPADPDAVYGYERLDVPITARNTADFALTGANLKGEVGGTVTAEVTFANKGPAWVANDVSSPIGVFEFGIPKGTTVTKAPDFCVPAGPDGKTLEGAAGASAYRCTTPYGYVDENTELPYAFRLRIDKAVTNAVGKVAFVKGDHRWGTLPFDKNRGNNTAAVVVNATGAGTGGTDDTGGTGGTGATGGSGSGGTGGGSGSGGGGAQGGTGTHSTGGTDGGALADTGTGIAPLIGGGAAALVMVGGLFLASGRKPNS
ncbi:hypothetical protein [Streptomyces sp. NBC_00872]|uniref:hypothetical protein n=1 Tax=Streptomyces sp. NBC_00872 TaxID=2903686 RepID=UPI0038658653|nr:hypothetical protein OG214_20655 [Streptomyces sp. NBC_00872]